MVSIIIPSYNDGEYVPEALESAFAQTYQDIEIIIVDDGSDDVESIETLKRCAEHPLIRFIRTNHMGLAAARNTGIRVAKGKYIMLLDADNKYAPSYVEEAVRIAEENPDVGIVYGEAEFFGEKTGHWDLPDFSIQAMLVHNLIDAAALFRKEDWERVGGFSESLKYGLEDYDFWLSIISLGRKVYKIHEILFYYRVRSGSLIHRFASSLEQMQETYAFIYKHHEKIYRANAYEHSLELRKTLIAQEFHIQNLSVHTNQMIQQYNQIIQQYNEISNSTIWRMTKPLRTILDALKYMLKK